MGNAGFIINSSAEGLGAHRPRELMKFQLEICLAVGASDVHASHCGDDNGLALPEIHTVVGDI